MKDIHDYLFVDHKRILSYFEQIASPDSLKRKQKCPAWSVSISIGGPKVAGKQSVALRDPTIYEAINDVEKYLHDSQLIVPMNDVIYYWTKNNRKAFFVRDVLSGRRALIAPPEEARKQGIKPLAVWVMDPIVLRRRIHYRPDDAAPELRSFLIESFSDSDSSDVPGRSGFTALEFIVHVMEKQTDQFRKALLGTNDLPEPRSYDRPPDSRFNRFANDPEKYLETLGTILGPRKTIDCLFRVRFIWDEDGYHDAPPHSKMGSVGYPLYIAEKFD
jgi:hypothetical protein